MAMIARNFEVELDDSRGPDQGAAQLHDGSSGLHLDLHLRLRERVAE